MPAKRRPPALAESKPAKKRQSKLAKENDITAEEEAEILEAFSLFATAHAEYADEKEGVIRVEDVRRCLIALNTPPTSPRELAQILSTLDPSSSGHVPYRHFVAVAALKLHARSHDPDALSAEVAAAFNLFTKGDGDRITLAHLKRVARELREDVGENVLRDMLREAGETDGRGGGVGLEEFEGVMRRAGVFG
ncbi:hypothetical protein LTR16_004436 [Cryomyces antarcticus]|uniref:Calmodulin n=1 Tax=Cryomyces antarcticus TaxID=329879 RepID=A0ABR0LPK7_9PEZI|nr:hypothetical protein LTR39_003786 [Cryomyces antarcticus]KAK5013641.1 hypothetical protein LTR60_003762 [Cryomyces antarcticus]KAK5200916.1 hypothetical protein LTR16_004436 [Cryomyces antarcticus]